MVGEGEFAAERGPWLGSELLGRCPAVLAQGQHPVNVTFQEHVFVT